MSAYASSLGDRRATCATGDDNPDTLRKRLQAYHTQTTPLISYYSAQNIVRKIDASTDQNKIFECIKNAFEEMKGRKLYYYA